MNITVLDKPLASGPRTDDPTFILWHSTAGTSLSGAIRWLRKIGFSYHYLIDTSGLIVKCVPTRRRAHHAGVSSGPDGNFCNRTSIGIAFVNPNDGKTPLTKAQLQAARELLSALTRVLPIKYQTTHRIVSPGRKTDPKNFNLMEFAQSCDVWVEPWKQNIWQNWGEW